MKNTLRKGFSTGSVSTAAIKASIRYYFDPAIFSAIEIKMPGGENAYLNIAGLEKYELYAGVEVSKAVVIKDSGDDDSDVTGGIKICANFTSVNKNEIRELKKYYEKLSVYNIIKFPKSDKVITLILASSKGIGRATRPGLPVRPGFPAINPVPFKMIELAASEEMDFQIKKDALNLSYLNNKIFISVLYIPEGEETAKRTLNPRLGIEGGISILGTTGYVVPISTKAWLETIKASLRFLSENKIKSCVYTPGRYSEKIALNIIKDLPQESFIEIGDYVAYSVRKAAKSGIKKIILVCQFGKIIKIAQGARNTNAKYGSLNLNFLEETVRKTFQRLKSGQKGKLALEREEYLCACIAKSNTSRQAFDYIISEEFEIFSDILGIAKDNLTRMSGAGVDIEVILISYEGRIVKRI
ncbi:MAG: cobalt-precorrin-5B (C(1))-methyltransferase CbiD [bacterium]